MKEFVISEVKSETAVLVGLITHEQDEAKTTEYLDELEFLAETAGARVVKRFTQRVGGPNQTTYVGKGKLEEIKEYIKTEEDMEREVGMVIFDDELSAKQIRNIENELKVKILDRTSLILDIFAMRAQTANAKTQVELAQYRYMLPACKDSGRTLSDKAAEAAAEEEKEAWDCADRERRSWRWTAVSSCNASPC